MAEIKDPLVVEQLIEALQAFPEGTPVRASYDCDCASGPVVSVGSFLGVYDDRAWVVLTVE